MMYMMAAVPRPLEAQPLRFGAHPASSLSCSLGLFAAWMLVGHRVMQPGCWQAQPVMQPGRLRDAVFVNLW